MKISRNSKSWGLQTCSYYVAFIAKIGEMHYDIFCTRKDISACLLGWRTIDSGVLPQDLISPVEYFKICKISKNIHQIDIIYNDE